MASYTIKQSDNVGWGVPLGQTMGALLSMAPMFKGQNVIDAEKYAKYLQLGQLLGGVENLPIEARQEIAQYSLKDLMPKETINEQVKTGAMLPSAPQLSERRAKASEEEITNQVLGTFLPKEIEGLKAGDPQYVDMFQQRMVNARSGRVAAGQKAQLTGETNDRIYAPSINRQPQQFASYGEAMKYFKTSGANAAQVPLLAAAYVDHKSLPPDVQAMIMSDTPQTMPVTIGGKTFNVTDTPFKILGLMKDIKMAEATASNATTNTASLAEQRTAAIAVSNIEAMLKETGMRLKVIEQEQSLMASGNAGIKSKSDITKQLLDLNIGNRDKYLKRKYETVRFLFPEYSGVGGLMAATEDQIIAAQQAGMPMTLNSKGRPIPDVYGYMSGQISVNGQTVTDPELVKIQYWAEKYTTALEEAVTNQDPTKFDPLLQKLRGLKLPAAPMPNTQQPVVKTEPTAMSQTQAPLKSPVPLNPDEQGTLDTLREFYKKE